MKSAIRLFCSLFVLWVFLVGSSLGCTIGSESVKDFDSKEYVFIGEVIGIAGPFTSKEFSPEAWGLRIRIDDAVYLPRVPTGYVEVVPFLLGADCSTRGTRQEDLIQDFPLGSKVKVIAGAAKLLPGNPGSGNLRLEISADGIGSITRNDHVDGKPMTSSGSEFDYGSYRPIPWQDTPEALIPFRYADSVLPHFELRKDLLRLRNTKNETSRIKILERLLFYPEPDDFDFDRIAKKYVKNSEARKSLIERRNAFKNRNAEVAN